MCHPNLNIYYYTIILLYNYIIMNSPDVVFVCRWIPMASGYPQKGPSGECLCLWRYTDRFVARAHCRPLYQDVSFKDVKLCLFCHLDIHEFNYYLICSYTQVSRTRLARPSGWMGCKPRRGVLPVRRNRRCQYGHPPWVLCGHVIQRPSHTANGQARWLFPEPTH